MWEDPIVAEIRRFREEHAARFNYDLRAICEDLREQERKSGRRFVSYPPRRIAPEDSVAGGTVAEPVDNEHTAAVAPVSARPGG